MSRLNRRDFLKTTAASTAFATFTISGTKSSGNVLGSNERIRHGVVGIKGRGSSHISSMASADGVDVTHLVDVDTNQFPARVKNVQDKGGNTPKTMQNFREALEDKNVDTISIATCNHTHSLIAIEACQAGKDVYVEKPLSHNIFEGRKLVEAAEKYDRVVQHGTQQRSSQGRANEIAAVHSEKYGKLLVSKGYCCKPRWSIGFKDYKAPPTTLDFDTWLGPAPRQPYHENIVHYNWHWFWDFGSGDTGNQGVHEIDVARWAIKGATHPNKIWSLGGRFLPEGPDQGQTPNMQITVFEYGDVILLFETRGLVANKDYPKSPPRAVRNEYYTTEGMITSGKFYPKNGSEPQPLESDESIQVTPGAEFGSFITAVRSRKPEDRNCDAEVGHYSSSLCHLSNISFRLGKAAKFDESNKTLGDNKEVVESLAFLKENLQAVGVSLTDNTYSLGRQLEFDPRTEKFTDKDANKMLTRDYRKGFVVPETV